MTAADAAHAADHEVEGATTLEAGDTIVLGGLRVRFEVAQPEATDAAVRSATYVPAATRVDAGGPGSSMATPPVPTAPTDSEGGSRWLPIAAGAIAAGAAAATVVVVIARVL